MQRIGFKRSIKRRLPSSLKELAKAEAQIFRIMGSDQRALPNFLVLGAQRSGTTSFYSCLAEHPQIRWASRKAIHYFDLHSKRSVRWYRSHFPFHSTLEKAKGVTGEASTMYLFHPLVPRRIHRLLPSIKLIALLRNPVQRAISHYFHEVSLGVERRPVREALEHEDELMEREMKKIQKNQNCNSMAFRSFSYRSRGVYIDQIKRYLNWFREDQLLLLPSECFFSNPETVMKRAYQFLGIDPGYTPTNIMPSNVGVQSSEIPKSVYEGLSQFFEKPNKELFDFTGYQFPW